MPLPQHLDALPIPAGLKHRHMNLMIQIRTGVRVQRNTNGQDIIRNHSGGRASRCDKDLRALHPTYATLEGTDGTFWRLTTTGDEALDTFLAARDANLIRQAAGTR